MKKILIGLLMMGAFSGFAGTLENKTTGETIDFNLDSERGEIVVLSRAAGLPNKTINLNDVEVEKIWGPTYMYLYKEALDADGENVGLWFPVTMFVPVTVLVLDSLAAPFQALKHAADKSRAKKDFRELMKAIVSDDVVRVSQKRFARVVSTLNDYKPVTTDDIAE